MPAAWESAPVLKPDDKGQLWQSAPIVTEDFDKSIDKRSGAPLRIRVPVGAAETPEDRLATLKDYYPDARPYGDDNFVFTDPRTKRPTLYNPPGFDAGDIPSIGPEIAEFLGGSAGVGATALAAVPTAGQSLWAAPVAAGLGAAGGREAYRLIARALLGGKDSRGLLRQVGDAATTAGLNTIGARGGELLGKGVEKVARYLGGPVRGALGTSARDAVDDFARAGVTNPPAGAVTGNKTVQMVEKALENTPGGSRVMQDQARTVGDQVADYAGTIAEGFGSPGTTQRAGEVIKEGTEAAGRRFAARVHELGNDLYNAVGGNRRVNADGVRQVRQEILDRVAADPGLERTYRRVLNELGDVVAGADANGGVSFRALHRLRMKVGEALPQPDASDYRGVTGEELGRLYAGLSQDMRQAAIDAGPAALRRLERHDRYIRMQKEVNLPVLNAVGRTASDEAAYSWAMNMSKDGGSRLYSLRRNIQPAEWDTVAASTLRRLGQPTAGKAGAAEMGEQAVEFSVPTFLTNWRKLSPEAQKALFGGTRYAQLAPELDNLVRVAARLKDVEKMGNPSGTARSLITGGAITAAGTAVMQGHPDSALGIIAGTVLAPTVAAKLITNPRFVRWVAAQAAPGAESSMEKVTASMSKLAQIGEANPEIRDDIRQFILAWRGAPTADQRRAASR